ncbi:hypothetical protein [Novosphingobium taihuense]|uniref:Uncharacterized protein n=1 Tax=Novosphingobium taihuense TaxID=260085 RepID=A0A7W7ETL8_9SPHN|nr:hypothetical protein [Novosphingobium taihuense]MBB4613021.1 hypothetical protein [Novosphingobium taihuense]TWH85165.1 hypothetical protein IQ25_01919 [Novosphingobium taihuense]
MHEPVSSPDKSGIAALLGTGFGFAMVGLAVLVATLTGMAMMAG